MKELVKNYKANQDYLFLHEWVELCIRENLGTFGYTFEAKDPYSYKFRSKCYFTKLEKIII